MTVKTPSPKWIVQVLRDRGFPTPTLGEVEKSASEWTDAQAKEAYELTRCLESGIDTSVDYDLLKGLLTKAKKVAKPLKDIGPVESPMAQERADGKLNHHIYASKGAITVELVPVRGERQELARKSIMIEAAQGGGNRSYDWDRKIYFSVMLRELPLVAAALLGLLTKPLVLANHGENTDKRLEIHSGGDRVVLKVFQGKRIIVVPALAFDCFAALDIALNALTMNSPHLAGDLLHTMLRRAAQMHNETKQE